MVSEATKTDFDILKNLEEELWLEETRFDRLRMEGVFADKFFEFGRSGKIHSREEALSLGKSKIDTAIPLDNFQIQMITLEVALVTYNSSVTYDDITQKSRRSSLWLRTGKSWRLQFHQGTPYE